MDKIVFEKTYTRDTSLIMQQLFPEMASIEFDNVGIANPHDLASIHHMVSGVTQIWENRAFHGWMMDVFLQENLKGEKFYDTQIAEFDRRKSELDVLWKKGTVDSVVQLQQALITIRKAMFGFAVMFWSGLNEETPKAIKDKSLRIRSEDSFWDKNDSLIRLSLQKLFPTLIGYEVAILKQELTNPPTKEDLTLRLEGFTIGGERFAELGTIEAFADNHPEYAFIDSHTQAQEANSVKGSVANKGYAKGIVKILMKAEDIGKTEEGDIIVSPMTTPNYIMAMKRAGAFVTDEGGTLCHAAIISREMGKPCIVGTQFATQVFKDGDVVELDTETGTVTKV